MIQPLTLSVEDPSLTLQKHRDHLDLDLMEVLYVADQTRNYDRRISVRGVRGNLREWG